MNEHTGWLEALRQEGEALEQAIEAEARDGPNETLCIRVDDARAAFVSKVRRLMAEASEKGARHAVQYETLVGKGWHFWTADSLLSEKDVNV